MKVLSAAKIALAILAAIAVGVLFVSYGTALPPSPFNAIQLDGPTNADSNGEVTALLDMQSCRVLILDADGKLTGMVTAALFDSPFDAMTDICVSGDAVYLLGVRFAPDSDEIVQERVAKYDAGGNFLGIVYEKSRRFVHGRRRPRLHRHLDDKSFAIAQPGSVAGRPDTLPR